MPEYGACASREISVSRTPDIGCMPKRRRTVTWLCPPPTSTRSLTIGDDGVRIASSCLPAGLRASR